MLDLAMFFKQETPLMVVVLLAEETVVDPISMMTQVTMRLLIREVPEEEFPFPSTKMALSPYLRLLRGPVPRPSRT
jgi:hypothetical protein